ncbi:MULTISPECIES: pyridoxamine 5'-phosphate oxidase family protein [unclassified Microbacterium]|uniref:pyridoxamine 5'-phosphate oxidase family protein n=1 Tax=unclassified Microbacterium TaxID=2609290 RepID=UPI001D330420|nr:pyridoxamine 5'-phosphate oxidase family protein [Microbacterium sp. Bi121]CAH0125267.1 hypothetical protein SRABI121_00582 [Microbacterium sp. Bi121]
MISDLQEKECYELLTSTTVGRIGFVLDERVEIFPVNFRASGQDLVLRTASDGILRRIADHGAQVAFEVDYHDDLGGTGWSVLIHGRLSVVADEDPPEGLRRVSPWAGSDRATPLRLAIDSISGRRVRREQH